MPLELPARSRGADHRAGGRGQDPAHRGGRGLARRRSVRRPTPSASARWATAWASTTL